MSTRGAADVERSPRETDLRLHEETAQLVRRGSGLLLEPPRLPAPPQGKPPRSPTCPALAPRRSHGDCHGRA